MILVDYREFRCDLPVQLYYHGFKVIPMMLKTGDYILSNSCIVERKAIETGDLSESLFQKRLDDQLKRIHEYSHPFLLIEFSDKIPFNNRSLNKFGYFPKEGVQSNGL